MRELLINIDAGHGSNTAGKRTPLLPISIDMNKDGKTDFAKGTQIREHYANVMCAYYYEKYLQEYGIKTMRTAWDDTNFKDDMDVSLLTRQQQVRTSDAVLSVSWHWNACGNGLNFNDSQGIEVFYHEAASKAGDSKSFAEAVLSELVKGTKQLNRGAKEAELAMCNCSVMNTQAAILIESGFMTNLKEAALMGDEAYWMECGKEAAKGTIQYLTGDIPTSSITKDGGKAVYWLQMMLNKHSTAGIPVDGDYGTRTMNAVVAYWKRIGFKKDGKYAGWTVGNKTIMALAAGVHSNKG
jgi:N-acetylmuramoyl-L-alanine amidase